MANYEATKYDFNASNLTGIQGVNTGIIVPWSDSTIPSGFLECDGSAVSQSTYADLFAVIGTTYGDPGGGNFNLPDLRDRCCQNQSPTKSFATSGGSSTVTVTGNLGGGLGNTTLTTPTIASHTHPYPGGSTAPSVGGSQIAPTNLSPGGNTGGGGAHDHPVAANFTGSSKSVLQPYITLIYIIKT